MTKVNFVLNGKKVSAVIDYPEKRLADILRNDFHLLGTKLGCEEGECGACTVLMNDKAVPSCLVPAYQIEGKSIVTIEGLAQDNGLDPIQQAFIDVGAVQCGFCIPGMIMAAKGLLIENPKPSDEEIKIGLSGNLCRCTGYKKIAEAVKKAAYGD